MKTDVRPSPAAAVTREAAVTPEAAARPAVSVVALALVALAAAVTIAVAAAYEAPRTFKASEILTPAQVKGPHYEVAPEVPTDGYLHVFQLKTDYGALEAEGKSILLLREYETGAIAQLDEVSKTGVFVKAAGDSLVKTGKGVAMAVSDPAATAKGMGAGLKRFGSNLGRSAKRTTDKAVDSVAGDDKDKKEGAKKDEKSSGEKAAETGEGIANSVLGVNGSARRWAQKVGVDPYSTNPVLRKSLVEFGRIDAAGGLAVKIAVPIPPVVGATATVGGLVWGQDPQALMKRNEQLLTQAGGTAGALKKLYLSKGFTLTLMTRFATALGALKAAKGAGDYVETAAEAESYREALFFVDSAEMAERVNKQTPIAAVLTDSRALVAKLADARAVVVLPVDWVRWTEAFDKASAEVASRAKAELGATKLELRTTAKLSPTAKAELAGRGWAVVEGLPTGFEVTKAAAAAKPAAAAAKPAPKK